MAIEEVCSECQNTNGEHKVGCSKFRPTTLELPHLTEEELQMRRHLEARWQHGGNITVHVLNDQARLLETISKLREREQHIFKGG